MKKITNRLGILILTFSVMSLSPLRGQDLLMDYIYGGVDDAEMLLQAYLEPFANILGSDLNAGWYNTARTHKLGGLDVMATVSVARAPSSMATFDASMLNLNGQFTSGSPTTAPTVTGNVEDRPTLVYSQDITLPDGSTQTVEVASFTLPNGAGVDFFPLPMAQLTVGLPLGFDVSARFVPMVQLGDYGEIGLWGVGGKHSISQWIPGIRELGFLDIAAQGGYTKVNSSVNVSVEPMPGWIDPEVTSDFHNQYVVQEVQGWTVNLIASQTFSVLTIYEGIGYASSMATIRMDGDYPVPMPVSEGEDIGEITYEIMVNPVDLSFQNMNNLRLNIGARIKLGVFMIHYDFTRTLYSTHTAGIGFTFR